MKKSKKIMLRVLPILMVLMVVTTTNVFGVGVGIPNTTDNSITAVTNLAGSVWNTIAIIIQILAIAAIVIAGVRYMFASADTKADIKQQTVILVVGAILVFAAVPIAQFVAGIANNVL